MAYETHLEMAFTGSRLTKTLNPYVGGRLYGFLYPAITLACKKFKGTIFHEGPDGDSTTYEWSSPIKDGYIELQAFFSGIPGECK